MTQDRYGVTIQGEHVPHNVAARDWYCACGYKVVTRWFDDGPHWRSVCSQDEGHDPDEFVHTKAIPCVQFHVRAEEARAQEVFAHLPAEMQEAIMTREPTQEELDRAREDARDRAVPVEHSYGRSKLFKE